jgi:hypothetical protein
VFEDPGLLALAESCVAIETLCIEQHLSCLGGAGLGAVLQRMPLRSLSLGGTLSASGAEVLSTVRNNAESFIILIIINLKSALSFLMSLLYKTPVLSFFIYPQCRDYSKTQNQ